MSVCVEPDNVYRAHLNIPPSGGHNDKQQKAKHGPQQRFRSLLCTRVDMYCISHIIDMHVPMHNDFPALLAQIHACLLDTESDTRTAVQVLVF